MKGWGIMEIKRQVEGLILEGERIIDTVGKKGLYDIAYYDGEEYEKWISKCIIIMDKYFKESNLYKKFITASEKAVGEGKEYYDTMIGVLKAIYEGEDVSFLKSDIIKKKKIFISHSSKNKEITNRFVELLKSMGVKNEQIYYSSYEETGVDFLQDCFQRINKEFNESELLVIFMISREFYSSKICLAEMGATWVNATNRYIPIIIPPYSYSNIEGVISSSQAAITLDDSSIGSKIEKMKLKVEKFLEIETKADSIEWSRKKEEFINYIGKFKKEIEEVAGKLLDIRIENQDPKTHIMFKVAIVNNTSNRIKLEEININFIFREGNDWNLKLDNWNVQALVVQPLEEIIVYLPIDVETKIKRSEVKVKESKISLRYYDED